MNDNEITNSKDIRKLRVVLRDLIARQKFIDGESLANVMDALHRLPRRRGRSPATFRN